MLRDAWQCTAQALGCVWIRGGVFRWLRWCLRAYRYTAVATMQHKARCTSRVVELA